MRVSGGGLVSTYPSLIPDLTLGGYVCAYVHSVKHTGCIVESECL